MKTSVSLAVLIIAYNSASADDKDTVLCVLDQCFIKCKRSLIVGSSTNKHLHQGALICYITKQHETLDTNNRHSCFIFNHPKISGFLNNDD